MTYFLWQVLLVILLDSFLLCIYILNCSFQVQQDEYFKTKIVWMVNLTGRYASFFCIKLGFVRTIHIWGFFIFVKIRAIFMIYIDILWFRPRKLDFSFCCLEGVLSCTSYVFKLLCSHWFWYWFVTYNNLIYIIRGVYDFRIIQVCWFLGFQLLV